MPAFFFWGIAVAISAGLLFLATRELTIEIFRKIVVPLAAPLFVLAVAAILLFGTAQGRDLGVGLLGRSRWVLFLLFLALLYWATGSWHAARLGLNRAWPDPKAWGSYAMWLRWLPRLIGASAHLFAAINIALAVSSVLPSEAPSRHMTLLALMGPMAIVVGTLLAWLQDLQYVRARNAVEAGTATPTELKAARWRARCAVLLLTLAAVAIALWMFREEAKQLNRPSWNPSEFVIAPAMSWVLASAAVFLLIVSYRRSIEGWLERSILGRLGEGLQGFFDEDNGVATSSVVLAVILSTIAFAVAIWALLDPHGLGERAGSVVIAFFAFGAYIAVIDLARILLKTRARFSAAVAALFLVVVFNSVGQTFHRVRLCGDAGTCDKAPIPLTAAGQPWIDPRPTVETAAKAWYKEAKDGWPGGEPVPMLIVATAGGGIRASVWTATVLDRLAAEMGRDRLRRHLFAVSGVSGGSVGAAFFAASLAKDEGSASAGDDRGPTARMLGRDFLAPTLATFAFVDLPSSILPEHELGDRSWTLERAWELASGEALSKPFLTLGAGADGGSWSPLLLFNATHQTTGKRIIASQVRVERGVFLDAFDMHALLRADMPASTAAHNSARFTYVSPAGKLLSRRDADGDGYPDDIGYVLDGGYFENFGALTALQLARAVKRTLGDRVRPVLLLISSDPAIRARDRAEGASICARVPKSANWPMRYEANRDGGGAFWRYLNQLTAPAAGLMSSREAHGIVATKELAASACDSRRSRPAEPSAAAGKPMADGMAVIAPAALGMPGPKPVAGATPSDAGPLFIHFRMCDEDGVALPPLGWVLSDAVQQKFPELLKTHCRNRDEWGRLARATDSPMSDWWNTPPARDGTALAEALAK